MNIFRLFGQLLIEQFSCKTFSDNSYAVFPYFLACIYYKEIFSNNFHIILQHHKKISSLCAIKTSVHVTLLISIKWKF